MSKTLCDLQLRIGEASSNSNSSSQVLDFRKGLSKRVTFKQKPACDERGSEVKISGESRLDKRKTNSRPRGWGRFGFLTKEQRFIMAEAERERL